MSVSDDIHKALDDALEAAKRLGAAALAALDEAVGATPTPDAPAAEVAQPDPASVTEPAPATQGIDAPPEPAPQLPG